MDGVFNDLITAVLGIAGTALASLLVALAVQLCKRMGLSLDAERTAQLEYVARQAVLRIEEQGAVYLKTHGQKLLPADKMRAAVIEVVSKLPRVDQDEARRVVEAVLPQLGLGAAAGLRELGKALQTSDAPAPAATQS